MSARARTPALRGEPAELAQRLDREPDELLRPPGVLQHRAPEQAHLAGDRVGFPRRRLARRAGVGFHVEHRGQHEGAGGAVDRGVVHLGELGDPAPFVDAFDDVQLPQRAAPVERPGVDATDHLGQLLRRAGWRDGVVADVVVEVEVGVLDPVRQVDPPWHVDQPAAEGGQLVDALENRLPRRLHARAAGSAGGVVDVQRRDVAEGGLRLHVEESGVDPRELFDGPERTPSETSARRGGHGRAVVRLLSEWRTASTHPTATHTAKMNHCTAYDRCGPSSSSGTSIGSGNGSVLGRGRAHQLDVHRHDWSRQLAGEAVDVDALDLGEFALGGVAELTPAALLGGTEPADDLDVAGRRRDAVSVEGDEAPLDEQDPAVVELQRSDDEISGPPALGTVDDDELLVGEVGAAWPGPTATPRRRGRSSR